MNWRRIVLFVLASSSSKALEVTQPTIQLNHSCCSPSLMKTNIMQALSYLLAQRKAAPSSSWSPPRWGQLDWENSTLDSNAGPVAQMTVTEPNRAHGWFNEIWVCGPVAICCSRLIRLWTRPLETGFILLLVWIKNAVFNVTDGSMWFYTYQFIISLKSSYNKQFKARWVGLVYCVGL